MSVTTVKLQTSVRDRLRVAADRDGQNMGEYIATLLDEHDRRERYAAARRARALNPPDEEYFREFEAWESFE